MKELVDTVISAVLQVAVFTLIPYLFFLFRKDKTVSFREYIGFYKPTGRSVAWVLLAALLILAIGTGMILADEQVREAVFSPDSVTGQFRQAGLHVTTVVSLLVIALVKTSLSEEILFRGFIARRLVRRFGFATGNTLQAVLFGLVHLLLFYSLTATGRVFPLVFIFLFSTMAGWVIGYIKEKLARGSIIPGWIAHGLGNTVSYTLIAFVL